MNLRVLVSYSILMLLLESIERNGGSLYSLADASLFELLSRDGGVGGAEIFTARST